MLLSQSPRTRGEPNSITSTFGAMNYGRWPEIVVNPVFHRQLAMD